MPHAMNNDDLPPDAIITTRIEILRYLTTSEPPHTDITTLNHWQGDGEGDPVPLVELLGLLRLAEDTALREALGEPLDNEDEDT